MRRVTAKKFITSSVLCVLVATALPALAAFTAPKHDGYVTDGANVLSESAEQSLEALATELDEKTTAQMAVLTVPTLDGTPIETAALTVARQWGIGQKGKNNGLLILLAVNDRKVRTEIGYGLEGIITDGTSGQIRDTYMVPYFKKGNYEQGLLQGGNALAGLIAKDAGVTLSGLSHMPDVHPKADESDEQGIPWFVIVFLLFFILPMFFNKRRGGSGYYGGVPFFGGFGGGGYSGGGGGGGFGGFDGGGFGGGGSSGDW